LPQIWDGGLQVVDSDSTALRAKRIAACEDAGGNLKRNASLP
jgi:hypothetical protein